MKNITRGALVLLGLAALAGCHARWNPLASAPDFNFRAQSKPVESLGGKKVRGNLDPKSGAWAYAFRYELPSKGSLQISAKPSNPAAQINFDLYSEGKVPIATTEKSADKKLVAPDLDAGTYYVRTYVDWKSDEETSFDLTVIYKPTDADEDNKEYKTQAGARELPFDKSVEDGVDYSARKRTHWWKLTTNGQGGLSVKFDNQDKDKGAKIDAYFVDPNAGAPVPVDPTVGFKTKDDMPAGDYFVKVEAKDAGDAGRYTLKAMFKQGDLCKNGGDFCTFSGAEELKLPKDTRKGDVDYTKGKAFHWYKLVLKDKGRVTLNFKPEGRGSKAVAFILKKEDDDGEPLKGNVQKEVTEPGELYIKVAANEPGDAGKYALLTEFATANSVTVDIVEIASIGGCSLTVAAGTNQGVRDGFSCKVLTSQGGDIDTCIVDRAFSNLAKVRPMGSCSKIPKSGKVQIALP